MLAVERALRGYQLVIELGQRQPRRQYRVLNVVEPIVAAGDPASLGRPALGPWIWRVDADVDDFRLLDTPFANDTEAFVVPVRIGDQVDRDHDPERAGKFERLEIAAERDPFAMLAQTLFVNRFEANEHVFEAEFFPEAEHLLVAQQYVAAGFEVIFLANAGADDRLAEFHAVPLLYEGDVVDDEDTGLADRPHVLDDALRAHHAIAATVEGPGAAEGAVPRTASREFDGGAGIEGTEKIFAAMAQKIACRHQIVE